MTPADIRLFDIAETLDVAIHYRPLRDDRDGQYVHAARAIHLRPGLHARHHRSVLAHELAHAVFGDVPSRFGPVTAKQERRAEEWAALRLIHHDDYSQLEQVYGAHPSAIAQELGVMTSIVKAYQGLLHRIGSTTYVDPRMGTGQWMHRVEVG